jgi:hypothetical protein
VVEIDVRLGSWGRLWLKIKEVDGFRSVKKDNQQGHMINSRNELT